MTQNEDTRVKIPALITLTRLGYEYLSLKEYSHRLKNIDVQTNIFTSIFFESMQKINPQYTNNDFKQVLQHITNELDYDDLGKTFYKRLIDQSNIKLIDFTNFSNNSFHVVTELEYINGDDVFRPDITILINGLPLIFIEVKKPNNKEGILAERNRINVRFQNNKFRRFINITQLFIFSNNMPYEENAVMPLQGAFYCSSAKKEAFFNILKEEERAKLEACVSELSLATENFILQDTNYPTLKSSVEYETNKDLKTPTNSIILSLLTKERIKDILRYALAYVEYEDEQGKYHLEKHIMRYPQFFASLAIQKKLAEGKRKGVIWHTQGSGKTALSYYNIRWLTDYFQKQNIITKFYFIVDRIDLKNQAMNEFAKRGLRVKTIDSKEDFVKDIRQQSAITNTSGELEITVLNIHKFSENSHVTNQNDYNLQTQRIYFIDEAHRSYSPKGSFLGNLFASDPNAIMISLTGTPLLPKKTSKNNSQGTTDIFGEYFHKYYYNQSISDGYTLKLIREDIETSYKMKLKTALAELEIQKGSLEEKQIYAHENFIRPMLEYILNDLKNTRIRYNENLGAMVVCHSSEQAKALNELFEELYPKDDNVSPQKLIKEKYEPTHAALILCDVNDKDFRKEKIAEFKRGQIDILFVYNMLLTGFDAPRLKKLYLNRQVNDHNLLQTLTRVNRPYKQMRQGFVVDFVDIRENFDKTNQAYWNELQKELGESIECYTKLFKSQEEILQELEDIKNTLWCYDTVNKEIFSNQMLAIHDKQKLYTIKKALENAKELYNIATLNGYGELIEKIDFKHINKLLSYIDGRIQTINLFEKTQSANENSNLINEAMEDIIFSFVKRGEEELTLADDFHKAMKRTREAILHNIDHNDPEWISLKNQLETFFHKRDFTDITQKEMKEHIKTLDSMYTKATEINRINNQICHKYQEDTKYVRVHNQVIRENIFPIKEYVLCDIMNKIKTTIDNNLLKQNIMDNETVFSKLVINAISSDFKNSNISIELNIKKYLQKLLVQEYYKELQNYDR